MNVALGTFLVWYMFKRRAWKAEPSWEMVPVSALAGFGLGVATINYILMRMAS